MSAQKTKEKTDITSCIPSVIIPSFFMQLKHAMANSPVKIMLKASKRNSAMENANVKIVSKHNNPIIKIPI